MICENWNVAYITLTNWIIFKILCYKACNSVYTAKCIIVIIIIIIIIIIINIIIIKLLP